MPTLVRQPSWTVSIGGTEVPVKESEVILSASGQLATATAQCSIALMNYLGVSITSLAQSADGATFDVQAGFDGQSDHIFGGILDHCEWDLASDSVIIKALDYGVVLRDTNATVASLLNYRNQSVGQIISTIANNNGFTPKVTDPGVKAGPFMNNENSYNPHPQPYATMIQNLAEQFGYDWYTAPDKQLYFGPEQTQGSFEVVWGASPSDKPDNPLQDLRFLYQPRDANEFQVKVISHDPATGKLNSAHKSMNSNSLKRNKKSKSPTQIIGLSNGSKTSASKSGGTASKKLTFVYRMDGLSPEACELKAQGIAKDLAKRLVVAEGCLEGLAKLKVHSELNIMQGNLDCQGFDGLSYGVTEVRHHWSPPQFGGGGTGFKTHFKALAQVDGGS